MSWTLKISKQIDHEPSLLWHCSSNDRGAPLPTTLIDMLLKIVRGRGLARNSSEKYQFLQ
jgi:hypothetical protein